MRFEKKELAIWYRSPTEEAVTSQKVDQLFFKDNPGEMDFTDSFKPNNINIIPGCTRSKDDCSLVEDNVENNCLHKKADAVGPLAID